MIQRIEALNELTRLSQEAGMYRTPRELRECGDPLDVMRHCYPCRRMRDVKEFGRDREGITDNICLERKAIEQRIRRRRFA